VELVEPLALDVFVLPPPVAPAPLFAIVPEHAEHAAPNRVNTITQGLPPAELIRTSLSMNGLGRDRARVSPA
jgi:hypothetical protein